MIYVHVPFCRSFCTYCDFYSEIASDACPGNRYTDDLCAEIDARRGEIAASAGVRTLYIGGGTPSVLPLQSMKRIVDCLNYGPYDEFTVEVNPEDIVEKGPEYVRGLLELGVNRISMGVQSLDDGILRWMNRRHSADGARKAWRIISDIGRGWHGLADGSEAAAGQGQPSQTVSPAARPHRSQSSRSPLLRCQGWHGFAEGSPAPASGISRSIDLITGVPGMTAGMLEKTVDEVLQWRPEHISAYQLSIEEGSALAKMIARGQVSELPDEECRAQYELLCRKLSGAGYHHYEISNWALPGHEALHNSAYWTRQPYVGLGPGAHSLEILSKKSTQNLCTSDSGSHPSGRELDSGESVGQGEGQSSGQREGQSSGQREGQGGCQIRKWNSKSLCGWKEEGREVLSDEEIREEEIMLLARTDRGPIPERDWFIADELIAKML